jgi:DNA-directed RNA polymerase subunit K/omega
VVHRPSTANPFEFVRLASLRTAQLIHGCQSKVPASHRPVLTAQLEVAAGKIVREPSLKP